MSSWRRSAIRNPHSALQKASYWMLCAALVAAPWNYGSVSEPGIVLLNLMAGAALVLWLAAFLLGLAQRGRRNRGEVRNPQSAIRISPPALLIPVAGVLLLGWFMALNAKAIYDSQFFLFVPVGRWWPDAIGSIDQAVSVAMMVRVSLLLGTIFLVADLVRDPRWLLRLWWTLGLAGGSIALLGLMQKASGAQMIFWTEPQQAVGTFFATFFYHGNAGAFLNLTLPLTIGLAWRALTRPRQPVVRALWVAAAVISVVAVFSNTSRMSQALAAGMLLVLAVALLPKAFGLARARMEWPTALIGTVVLALALFAVVRTSHLDRAFARWETTGETISSDARWDAAKAAWASLPEAGWTGFGPGTFAVVFPYWTPGFGRNLDGRWIHLHQDYLQTAMEWGWLGAGLFGWVFFGGMGVGARGALRNAKREMRSAESERGEKTRGEQSAIRNSQSAFPRWLPRQRLLVPLVLLALGSVALHALVDFPLQVASIQLYAATYLGICWGSVAFGGRVNGAE